MISSYALSWGLGHVFIKNNYYSDFKGEEYNSGTILTIMMCFMFANISLMMSLPCFKDVNNSIASASALSHIIDRVPEIRMYEG